MRRPGAASLNSPSMANLLYVLANSAIEGGRVKVKNRVKNTNRNTAKNMARSAIAGEAFVSFLVLSPLLFADFGGIGRAISPWTAKLVMLRPDGASARARRQCAQSQAPRTLLPGQTSRGGTFLVTLLLLLSKRVTRPRCENRNA